MAKATTPNAAVVDMLIAAMAYQKDEGQCVTVHFPWKSIAFTPEEVVKLKLAAAQHGVANSFWMPPSSQKRAWLFLREAAPFLMCLTVAGWALLRK